MHCAMVKDRLKAIILFTSWTFFHDKQVLVLIYRLLWVLVGLYRFMWDLFVKFISMFSLVYIYINLEDGIG